MLLGSWIRDETRTRLLNKAWQKPPPPNPPPSLGEEWNHRTCERNITTCLFHWPRNILMTQWTRIGAEAYSTSVGRRLHSLLIAGWGQECGAGFHAQLQLLTFIVERKLFHSRSRRLGCQWWGPGGRGGGWQPPWRLSRRRWNLFWSCFQIKMRFSFSSPRQEW